MNERVAYVQNGREIAWSEVTTEDLRVTLIRYPDTDSARFAAVEWFRRFGKNFMPYKF